MSWAKREAVTNLAILGEDEGQRRKIGGLLIGIPRDKGYPDKVNYELVQKDGEVLVLSGSASLARQINEQDVGKFVKCEFQGWGKSPNGKFKVIEVNVWEGDVTDDMKSWPRYREFAHNGKKAQPKPAVSSSADDDGFSAPARADEEEDDSLPF